MNCPKCEYEMASNELNCPRCIKFGLASASSQVSIDRSTIELRQKATEVSGKSRLFRSQNSTSKLKIFKPTWFDYLMQVLSVLVLISLRGMHVIVAYFYCLLVIAYIIDWAIHGIQKLRAGKTI